MNFYPKTHESLKCSIVCTFHSMIKFNNGSQRGLSNITLVFTPRKEGGGRRGGLGFCMNSVRKGVRGLIGLLHTLVGE